MMRMRRIIFEQLHGARVEKVRLRVPKALGSALRLDQDRRHLVQIPQQQREQQACGSAAHNHNGRHWRWRHWHWRQNWRHWHWRQNCLLLSSLLRIVILLDHCCQWWW